MEKEYIRKSVIIDEESEDILKRYPINLSALVRNAIRDFASQIEGKKAETEEA